ncbi:Golgi-body localisation protein domain [Striga asiatica]|uniref:Golgi-body localisation protein domain n=1 Tax=Striga asiatica TaxID=4170 RepID=A0A5A7RJY1_STRAF|nr:Golgi-body localisation protein domain [Striga asiatica]
MHEAIGGISDSNIVSGGALGDMGDGPTNGDGTDIRLENTNVERVAVTVTVGDGAVIVILWGGKAEALQSHIVLSGHIVHQSWVDGLLRVHVASSPGPHGCLCPIVQYGPSLAVSGVGGCHHGRADHGRGPVRVGPLEQGGDARDVWAGHGSAGEDVELCAACAGRGQAVGPGGEDVDSRGNQLGLEIVACLEGRASGREGSKGGSRMEAEIRGVEDDGGGGIGARRVDVAEDCVPHGLFYGEARKHMRFGLEDGAADDDHSSAPGLSHGLSQLSGPTRADDNLATYLVATEPVVAAVSVCEGEKGVVGEEWATAVERHATDDLPIPEHDICWEPPVD